MIDRSTRLAHGVTAGLLPIVGNGTEYASLGRDCLDRRPDRSLASSIRRGGQLA
jgi:hypothetical protein